MPLKKFKPTSPGRRFMAILSREEITRDKPEKSLTRGLTKSGGRNNNGRTTSFWRGGGHKRRYRAIDFRRDKIGVPGKVSSIEYDPNRSARVALISYLDGEKRYIVAPDGLQIGEGLRHEVLHELRRRDRLTREFGHAYLSPPDRSGSSRSASCGE